MTVARLRPLAEADLVERARYSSTEGGTDLGVRFFEAAVASLRAIEKMPNAGSPRIGELCDISGLRVRRIEGFPVGWFYFVRPDHADVVRLSPTPKTCPSSRPISTPTDPPPRWACQLGVLSGDAYSKPDRGVARSRLSLVNQDGIEVMSHVDTILLRRRNPNG